MKTLLLIRHGESEADILGVHEGRADFSLTESGHRQAEALGHWVAEHYPIDLIFASTLRRAAQTAQHLSDAVGVEIRFDEDLMEFNNGLLAGLPFGEAEKRYPKVENLPPDRSVYGQESQLEFRARADRVLKRCLDRMPEDATAAIVSHGGMINQLFASLLNLPLAAPVRFATGDTGVHLWKLGEKDPVLLFSNRQEHLRDL